MWRSLVIRVLYGRMLRNWYWWKASTGYYGGGENFLSALILATSKIEALVANCSEIIYCGVVVLGHLSKSDNQKVHLIESYLSIK